MRSLRFASPHPPVQIDGDDERASDVLTRLGPSWGQYLADLFVSSQTPISGLMSRDPVCVAPDLSVEELTTLVLERGLSGVLVIDAHRKLLGRVSTTDLLREVQEWGDGEDRIPLRVPSGQGIQMELGRGFHATRLARATVEEVMTPSTFAVPQTASVAQAAALMAFEEVNQVPVVGPGSAVVGELTALDLMRWLAQQSGFLLPHAHPSGLRALATAS